MLRFHFDTRKNHSSNADQLTMLFVVQIMQKVLLTCKNLRMDRMSLKFLRGLLLPR